MRCALCLGSYLVHKPSQRIHRLAMRQDVQSLELCGPVVTRFVVKACIPTHTVAPITGWLRSGGTWVTSTAPRSKPPFTCSNMSINAPLLKQESGTPCWNGAITGWLVMCLSRAETPSASRSRADNWNHSIKHQPVRDVYHCPKTETLLYSCL